MVRIGREAEVLDFGVQPIYNSDIQPVFVVSARKIYETVGRMDHMLQNTHKIQVRNSSIELLRIIAMVMIVFHHFACHGGFSFGTSVTATHFWYNFIVMGGKLGVDIFVLISGYYLITNNKTLFNINKTVKFVGQVFSIRSCSSSSAE